MKRRRTIISLIFAMSALAGCEQVNIEPEESKACSHNWSEWNITKEPTCLENGKKARSCSICDAIEEKTISKKEEHDWVEKEDGSFECSVCGSTKPAPEKEIVDMQLSNDNGMLVKFDLKGAKIRSLYLDDLKIAENGFVAGRVANRIANASFQLDGKTYNVNKNNGQHCLHGGSQGFGEINWTKTSQTAYQIVFELDSRDGDQGFPGNIHVSTTYTLSEDGTLDIEYRAKSDAKTIFNPTNHLYMNMNGVNTNTWQNHSLWVNADTYTKAKSDLIPTGEIVSVSGTTLDYSTKKDYKGNNDSNLVLKGDGYRKVAELTGKTTNITCEVSTDRVGLQVYNDNSHICLEAQDFPDAIHHDNFPSIILEANAEYYSKTTYKFSKVVA